MADQETTPAKPSFSFGDFVAQQRITGPFDVTFTGLKGILGKLVFFSKTRLVGHTNSTRTSPPLTIRSHPAAEIYTLHITPFLAIGFVNPVAKREPARTTESPTQQ